MQQKIRIGLMGVGVVFALVVPRVMTWSAERQANEATRRAEEQVSRMQRGAGPENETANEKLARKLGTYAEPCLNALHQQVRNAERSYFRWANSDTLEADRTRPSSVLRLSSVSRCETAISNAARLEPPLPDVESTALIFLASAKALDGVLERASEYYGEENYKDDSFALGNQLHAELRAKFQAAEQAYVGFVSVADGHSERMVEARIAELARVPGRGLEMRITRASRDALLVVKATEDADIDPEGKLTGIDVSAFQTRVTALEATIDELKNWYAGHPNEHATVENASGYIDALSSHVLPEAKRLARRLREGTGFTESELNRNPLGDNGVEGSPGRLVDQYNDAIDYYNRIRFRVLTTEEAR